MEPTEIERFTAHYLEQLGDDENAWFALVEALPAVLPELASAFRSENDAVKRAMILNVVWQHRDPSTIAILSEGLQDSSPRVWKEALDGLVTIGGPESVSTIEAACNRKFSRESDEGEFREFLDEALQQLRLALFGDAESRAVGM